MNSTMRNTTEAIKRITGKSLVRIHYDANQMVSAGLCKDTQEALEYILEILTTKEK